MSDNKDKINLPAELRLDVNDIFEDALQLETWIIEAIKNPEWLVEAKNKRVKQDWNNLKKQTMSRKYSKMLCLFNQASK
ncbi:MAG: hypothetical protein EA365_04400 [Gloeocapsa sp. DLM2.Bin57]|nr:MAG: hypothetical protein EA365_04400 [Gloeocapsa sp. DLM2.Bin57]